MKNFKLSKLTSLSLWQKTWHQFSFIARILPFSTIALVGLVILEITSNATIMLASGNLAKTLLSKP